MDQMNAHDPATRAQETAMNSEGGRPGSTETDAPQRKRRRATEGEPLVPHTSRASSNEGPMAISGLLHHLLDDLKAFGRSAAAILRRRPT